MYNKQVVSTTNRSSLFKEAVRAIPGNGGIAVLLSLIMKQLTYRGIAYKKNDKKNSSLKLVSGRVNHVYRGTVYHYENSTNNEKQAV